MAQSYTTVGELQEVVGNINDLTKAYDPDGTAESVESQRAALREKAFELLKLTSSPADVVWQSVIQQIETITLRTAMRLGIPQAVPLEGSISRTDLAKKINAAESLVERLMRMLVGTGVFDQLSDGDYKHTHLSLSLVDQSAGPTALFLTLVDVYTKPMAFFDEYMVKTKKNGLWVEPSSNTDNPLVACYGNGNQNTWEALNSNPEVLQNFQFMLKASDAAIPPVGPWFDFNQFKATGPADERIQLVDVGGGIGRVMQDILAASPQLDPTKCVFQDQEPVVAAVPQEIRQLGIKSQAIDFLKEQPIKGARAYFMRFITHDYSDADLINILSHVSNAMAPDSVLIIAEGIIPERLNYHTLKAGAFDGWMLVIGGKERTESGFVAVLEKAGLSLAKINRIPASFGVFLECRKIN